MMNLGLADWIITYKQNTLGEISLTYPEYILAA